MKTLIIDNHTKHIDELVLLFPHAVVVRKEDLTSLIDVSGFDLIVISGGSGVSTVLRFPEEYKIETHLVLTSDKPILGICLGSEIITHAFGGVLKELDLPHRGIVSLHIENGSLKNVLNSAAVEVHESHRIGIKEIPKDFVSCASSDHGPEIIKHKEKPIIGMQFHPEIHSNKDLFSWIFEELGLVK